MIYTHLHTIKDCHQDSVNFLSFSPDGRFLVSGGDDQCLFLFDYQEGQDITKTISSSEVTSGLWIEIGGKQMLLVGYANGDVQSLDPVSFYSTSAFAQLAHKLSAPQQWREYTYGIE